MLATHLRRTALAGLALTGALALAQPALATDYCVAPNDTCGGTKLQDLQAALDAAAVDSAPDRIFLGTGTYTAPAQGFIYDPQFGGPIELVGADRSDTILQGTSGGIRTLAVFGGSETSVRDMRIVMPPDAASGAQALRTDGVVTNVSVVDDVSEKNDVRTGVVLLDSGVLDNSFVGLRQDHPTTGVVLAGGGAIRNNSGIDASLSVETGGGTIDRTHLSAQSAGVEVKHGSTKITSTRIGTHGMGSVGIGAVTIDGDASLELDGVTIIGPGDPSSGTGIDVGNPYVPTASIDAVIKNTIIRGQPWSFWVGGTAPGHAHVAASYSDYDSSAKTVTGGANTQFTETHVSFVGEVGFTDEGDYELMPGSPLIDAGDPTTAQGLDVVGHPLVTDGDGDGIARRDVGATERPGVPPTPADPPPVGGDQPTAQPAGPGAVTPSRDTLAPALSGLRLSRKVFAVGRARTAIAARSARGTRISYTLSEDAKVVVKLRRVGAKRAAGKLTRTAKRGVNTIRFSGRIGARALKPGRYRAIVTATDAAGNRSVAKSVRFRIAKR